MILDQVRRNVDAINRLTPEKRAELYSLLGSIADVWFPLPGPQRDAYYSKADILFYGGAAGPGKTEIVLGIAKNLHRRSIIFRRTYGQLAAIKDRGQEIIRGKFREFPTPLFKIGPGQTLELAAVENERDWQNFQGRPHDFIGIDEICQFSKSLFLKLTGWLRHEDLRQRTRVVCVGNPPLDNVGDWVIVYWGPWLNPGDPMYGKVAPGELLYYTTIDGEEIRCPSGDSFLHRGERVKPMSRTFIPARLHDNPYLMLSGYERVLQSFPEPMRTQLLNGDFLAGKSDNARQVIPSAWVDAAMKRWAKTPKPDLPLTAIGVDVARGGPDNTVISPRRGYWFDVQQTVPGTQTPDGDAVAVLVSFHVERGTQINVDVIGIGASAVDRCRAKFGENRVFALMSSERSEEWDAAQNFQFTNRRSQWWWRMREALDPANDSQMCLPPDESLKADLCAPLWSTRGDKIQVESKDEIKKRIGRSPDRGDAAVYALVYHHTQVAIAVGRGFR